MPEPPANIAVLGAGPAGLMAADILSGAGHSVAIYDAMPSPARKFLMAGKSGLNITHQREAFLSHYPHVPPALAAALSAFGPKDVVDWMRALDITPVTGSTGRVFPREMKASPLLRAWLGRLGSRNVALHMRHRWTGWNEAGELVFDTPTGQVHSNPDAQVFAFGGGSWKRLGSDGAWAPTFRDAGIHVTPFQPSNCGFNVNWSDRMKTDFAGTPVKSIAVRLGEQVSREEFVVTDRGVESGAIFSLSLAIRDKMRRDGHASLTIDLAPDVTEETLRTRLSRSRGKQSLSNYLRKAANLTGVKRALLFEFGGAPAASSPEELAQWIKALPLPLGAPFPVDEAISTAGGVAFDALDNAFMVTARPGIFCAGEMLDWDAPTGGYLLTACLATGRAAGLGALQWLAAQGERD